MGKARLSRSHLASPDTPIQALALRIQEYLYLPDPGPLYVLLGAVAANMMEGPAVWLMLVGPSGCGKTALLNTVLGLDRARAVDEVSGVAALLSGVKRKEMVKGSSGGMLTATGDRGLWIMPDFTSVLDMPRESGKALYGALRRIYDGHWERDVGSDGHRRITWEGKLAVMAGVTNAIDDQHVAIADMGQRWMFYRYPMGLDSTDGWAESNRALDCGDRKEMQEEMTEIVKSFFESQELSWDNYRVKRSLTQGEKDKLICMAQVAARCRSVVKRDNYNKQIVDVPTAEFPTRIVSALGQLLLGMEYLGVPNKQCWDLVRKVAMDCMPLTRRVALTVLMGNGVHGSRIKEIRDAMRVSESTTKRTLEDLEAQKILVKGEGLWRIEDWAKEALK